MQKLQSLAGMKNGIPDSIKSCKIPKCAACIHGKQTHRSSIKDGSPIANEKLKPGQQVSVDHMESKTPGRSPTRLTLRRNPVNSVAIFIDLASQYTFASHQTSNDLDETIGSKNIFERHAKTLGTKNYITDPITGLFQRNCLNLNVQNQVKP